MHRGAEERIRQNGYWGPQKVDLQYDTDYVDFLLEELQPNAVQCKAFQFYTMLYCVDFIGERGMIFLDKQIQKIIDKLNGIFDDLLREWNT